MPRRQSEGHPWVVVGRDLCYPSFQPSSLSGGSLGEDPDSPSGSGDVVGVDATSSEYQPLTRGSGVG